MQREAGEESLFAYGSSLLIRDELLYTLRSVRRRQDLTANLHTQTQQDIKLLSFSYTETVLAFLRKGM